MTNHQTATRSWTETELRDLDRTPLIRVAAARPDGTLRSFVTIGHVRVGGDVLIRSLNGPRGGWYRSATGSGWGEIEVGASRIPVAFAPDTGREAEVDRALRSRYGDDAGVRRMTSSPAREATLRVAPLV